MEENKNINFRARVGVTISATPEEASILCGNDYFRAKAVLLDLIRSDRCILNGETYFPENDVSLDEDAPSRPEVQFDFNLGGPLHPPKERDFTIDTPHGPLHVYDKHDPVYPGVWVDVKQSDGRDVTLAMVEFIPGGEGLCDYDPSRPDLMRRQREEVPESRRDGDEATAGFVTRSWPDENHNMDDHNRTFHTGYQLPTREQDLDVDREAIIGEIMVRIISELDPGREEDIGPNGGIGHTMPDGKHHIFIYIDDTQKAPEGTAIYVIEPNQVIDGGREPMGDTFLAELGDEKAFVNGLRWCLDLFDRDNGIERAESEQVQSLEEKLADASLRKSTPSDMSSKPMPEKGR